MAISMESHSQLLKLSALMLDYPRVELREESLALHALIRTCNLPEQQRDGLAALLNELCKSDRARTGRRSSPVHRGCRPCRAR